jgi:hypothetical protein
MNEVLNVWVLPSLTLLAQTSLGCERANTKRDDDDKGKDMVVVVDAAAEEAAGVDLGWPSAKRGSYREGSVSSLTMFCRRSWRGTSWRA